MITYLSSYFYLIKTLNCTIYTSLITNIQSTDMNPICSVLKQNKQSKIHDSSGNIALCRKFCQ